SGGVPGEVSQRGRRQSFVATEAVRAADGLETVRGRSLPVLLDCRARRSPRLLARPAVARGPDAEREPSMTPCARRAVLQLLLFCLAVLRPAAGTAADAPSRLHSVRVLVLSTMLADRALGESGFSALVDADGHRLLFDTGARPTTVLENARELKVDLAGITDVVLSHNHSDHTGGLLTLRRENARTNPGALSRAYVGKGIFLSRPGSGTAGEQNYLLKVRKEYEDTGATFVEVAEPVQVFPGAWLTGPVPRVHPERNWSGRGQVRAA